MPFWAADRLSDAELLDMIAFIEQNDLSGGGDAGTGRGDGGMRSCGMTHSKIGQTAMLSTLAHDVSGMAEIIDDCTVRIQNFNYDGAGVNVQFYGGLNGDYADGVSMSENLLSGSGYMNTEEFAQLPEGTSFDDINGISVWCVPVGASFGDGMFQ